MIGAQGVQAREEFSHMGTAQRRCWRTHVWAHALSCDGISEILALHRQELERIIVTRTHTRHRGLVCN